MEQLHCLMWAISSEQNMRLFLDTWNSNDPRKQPLRRLSPDLADTLSIARAEGVIAEKGKARFALLTKGEDYLLLIGGDDDILVQEKRFLAGLRPISARRMWERLGSIQPPMGAAARGNT
ncbi:hypothetical protein ABZ755_30465 [Streptomyces griseoincarnatus]